MTHVFVFRTVVVHLACTLCYKNGDTTRVLQVITVVVAPQVITVRE